MDDQLWICRACTFHNQVSHRACCMCNTLRTGSRYLPLLHSLGTSGGSTLASLSLSKVPRILAGLLSGALTGMVATVGAFTGAVTGALACRATDNGCLRGAGLGAVAGAVLSVEVLEASRAYWHSERSRSDSSLLSLMGDLIEDLFSGRFVQEYLTPAVSITERWQVNTAEMSYEELYEIFGSRQGGIKGASEEFLESLPQHIITLGNRIDASGDAICCAICLQELEQGETARSLPPCHHTFHVNCIDRWLTRHTSCPVCRQYI